MALSGIRDRDLVIKEISKLQDQEFSEELFKIAHQTITKSIGSVFNDVDYGHDDYALMNDLKRDAYKFAAFKSANFSQTMKVADAAEKDKLMRAFEVQLDTEVTTATRAARSAKQWAKYTQTSDQFPNIEYLKSRSADKRDAHKKYYGLILPKTHPFWKTGLPPNDHGCKCPHRETNAPVTKGKVEDIELPKGIVGNTGIERKAFSDDHSFYTNLDKKGKKQVMDHHDKLAVNIPYPKEIYKSKGKVYVHDLHDKIDVKKNVEHAKYLADFGETVKIRPHGFKDNVKNPEYIVNGMISDLKTNTGSTVTSLIKSARKQRCEVIVFKMHPKESAYNHARELADKVNGILMRHYSGKFKGFWVIDKTNQVTYFTARKKADK